ncbi:hypothetical protein MPPM_2569 [Methylorubrum populi]|uniref:Uncharacterized protein n=1 Tax=Methylorubrum populi TaxID=223967 RepID=A0A160PEZ3_9HYPH|nr:hypothetical protein MPPM_2569 [Methylorubrum populi]
MTNPPIEKSFLHRYEVSFADGSKRFASVKSSLAQVDDNIPQELAAHWEEIFSRKFRSARLISCRAIVPPSETTKLPRTSKDVSVVQGDPPALAEFLCACFAPRKHRDGILGDLATDYRKHLNEGSAARAKRLYWGGVLATMWPLLRRWVARVAWSSVGASILKWWSS